MEIPIQMVMDLVELTRKTVMERLNRANVEGRKEGSRLMVESTVALPAAFGVGKKLKSVDSEKMRLTSAQADKVELELDVMRGKLLHARDVEREVNNMVSAFRARMMNLPVKAAPLVLPLADLNEAEEVLRDLVYEALMELSNYDPEKYNANSPESGDQDSGAAPETNRKRVGGPKKKTKQRSQRRTRPVEH